MPPPSYTLEIITAEGTNYRLEGGRNVKMETDATLSMEFDTDTERIGRILYPLAGSETTPPSPAQCILVLRNDYHGEVWRSPDPSRTFYNASLTGLYFGNLGGPFVIESVWTYQECDFELPRRLPPSYQQLQKLDWRILGF